MAEGIKCYPFTTKNRTGVLKKRVQQRDAECEQDNK